MRVWRGVWGLLVLGLDWLWCRLLLPESTHRKQILVVRLDAIGDFVLWMNTQRILQREFPDAGMTLVCHEDVQELAETLGCQIIPVSPKRFETQLGYRFGLLRQLRQKRFQLALHPVLSRYQHAGTAEAIIRAVEADQKVGWQVQKTGIRGMVAKVTARWYTQLIVQNHPHELMNNLAFATRITGANISPILPQLPPHSRPISEPYVVVFPGSRVGLKNWPQVAFAKTIRELGTHHTCTVVLCGGPSEAAAFDPQLWAGIPIQNELGKTTLTQLFALLQHAQCVISNDTAAAHIAAAYGTPTIVVMGGGQWGRFFPYPPELQADHVAIVNHEMPCYGCDWNCPFVASKKETAPCIAQIPVDRVVAEANRLLKTNLG
ncbi:MAG: glycosyltransferase family 9 protein [Candidatus Margulisiibacteriota bacterium]